MHRLFKITAQEPFMPIKQNTPGKITLLPAPEYIAAVRTNMVQLLDIRTPPEYDAMRIKGAINIDLSCFDSFIAAFEKLDKPDHFICIAKLEEKRKRW